MTDPSAIPGKHRRRGLGAIAAMVCAVAALPTARTQGADMPSKPTLFDTTDPGVQDPGSRTLTPWRRVPLDPEYSGAWVVAGDLDGDGQAEIVSARNVNTVDVHYTSAVVAQRLDGSVLWRWGDPSIGRRGLHHDVACQIHDWDGDGRPEVVLCTQGFLVELDGVSGRERRRIPIPPEATDCLVFADLSGRGRPTDVLVKTRYTQIWALDSAGRQLWTVQKPGGFLTAHQPLPVDVDGDGREEILAGYALLGADGAVRWVLEDGGRFRGGGHMDCARVLRRGPRPADCVLVLTCCGHLRLMAVTGEGRILWELGGHHFESIDLGRVTPARPGVQLLVDVVPTPGHNDQNELWLVGEDGQWLGRIRAEYTRFHALVDTDGDGLDEIVLPHSRGVFQGDGRRTGTLLMESQPDLYGGRPAAEGEIGNIVRCGDFDGDGVADAAVTAPESVCILRSARPAGSPPRAPLGTGLNATLY